MEETDWQFPRRLCRLSALFAIVLAGFTCVDGISWAKPSTVATPEPQGQVQSGGSVEADRSCAYSHFLRGKSAELDGRHREAIEAYEQAIACDAGADHVMRSLAMLLVRIGEKDRAIVWVNRLIALDPKDIASRTLLANLYSLMDRHDEAVLLYQAILADDPKNFNVQLLLSGLHIRAKDYAKARQSLEKLAETNPDSYVAHYYLAKLYREMRLGGEAAAAYRKALDLNWSLALAHELAELYEQEKEFDQALAVYRRALTEAAGDERTHARIANVYLRQGQFDKAMEELEVLRRVSADPNRVDLAVARILLDHKKYPEAVNRLEELLKKDPINDAARALLVVANYQRGDLAATKTALQQVRPGGQAYEESVLMLARLLEAEGDHAASEKVLREAIAKKESRRLNFYTALAALLHKQGKNDLADAVFKSAMQDFPDTIEVDYEYGLFLHRIDDAKGAVRQMEAVLARDPDHPHALNYLGYTWADEGRNLEQAKSYIERALGKLPQEGFIRDSLGWVYYRLGDFAAAVRELEAAVALTPDDPVIYEHLGDARLKNQDHKGARIAYEKAESLYEEKDKKEAVRRKLEALPSMDSNGAEHKN